MIPIEAGARNSQLGQYKDDNVLGTRNQHEQSGPGPSQPFHSSASKVGHTGPTTFPLHSLSFPGAPEVYGEPRGNAGQQLCWEMRDTWRKSTLSVQLCGAEATQRQMGRASGGSSGGDKQRKEMESE